MTVLGFEGFDVTRGPLAEHYDRIVTGPLGFDVLLTDLMMPATSDIGPADGFTTGLNLAIEARSHFNGPIAIVSLAYPPRHGVLEQCRKHSIEYFHKRDLSPNDQDFIEFMRGNH